MKITKNLLLIFLLFILFSCSDKKQSEAIDVPQSKTEGKSLNKDGLIAMVMKNGKYGYINSSGEYVIEPQYALARSFSNGVACVNMGGKRTELFSGSLGGVYAFIDKNNSLKFEGGTIANPTSFYNNFVFVEMENGKKGFINREGKLVIKDFDGVGKFRDGLAAAMKKEEKVVGFIDTLGNWKIKFDLTYLVGDFYEGLAYVKEEGKFGYVNTQGEMVIKPTFNEAFNFHEGLAAVGVNKKYGFIDPRGELVVPATYDNASDFSDGLCAVLVDGKWGFMDKTGKMKIENKFQVVRDFHEGFASALSENGKVGFIDKSGEWAIQPTFESAIDFKNGFAIIQQNGKLGFIDIQGKTVVEPQFERVDNLVNPQESNEILKVN